MSDALKTWRGHKGLLIPDQHESGKQNGHLGGAKNSKKAAPQPDPVRKGKK